MDVALLVNPGATSMSPRHQVSVHRLLAERHQVTMYETRYRGHAEELAAKSAAEGAELVVVLAGDGTLNEAANGLIGTECLLAPLPGGSTNVFARTLGLDDDPTVALRSLLRALEQRRIQRIGTGSVNGRHFLFHAGIGWDARLVREVERRAHLKRRLGHGLFVWAGLQTWFRLYDRTTPHFEVHYSDGSVERDGYFAVIQNSSPYTFVGHRPFTVATDAGLDRPLTSTTLTSMRSIDFLRLMASSLTEPTALLQSPIIDYRTPVESMRIESAAGVPLQVDGDDLGDHHEIDVQYHADSLRIVAPAAPSVDIAVSPDSE